VYVNRVGEAEELVRLDQARHDLRGCDVEVRDRVVDRQAVEAPGPCLGASRVDDLYPVALRLPEKPGNVCSVVLDLVVLDVLHHEPVVPNHGERSLVDDRRIVDLLVHVACVQRGHGSLHREGVPHPGVLVPCLEDSRDGEAPFDPRRFTPLVGVEKLVLRPVPPADIDLRSRDMGVNLERPGHHCLVLGVDDRRAGTDALDDLSILDSDVVPLSLDTLGRVVDVSVLDQKF